MDYPLAHSTQGEEGQHRKERETARKSGGKGTQRLFKMLAVWEGRGQKGYIRREDKRGTYLRGRVREEGV